MQSNNQTWNLTKETMSHKSLYQMLLQLTTQALHLPEVTAVKAGRGCAATTKSPGYHSDYLLWWLEKSEDIQEEELVANSKSHPSLESISFRTRSPDDWQRSNFILFLTADLGQGRRVQGDRSRGRPIKIKHSHNNSMEEDEALGRNETEEPIRDTISQPEHRNSTSRSRESSRHSQTLETIPEETEEDLSSSEEEEPATEPEQTEDEVYQYVETCMLEEAECTPHSDYRWQPKKRQKKGL